MTRHHELLAVLAAMAALTGCDRSGLYLVPSPHPDFDAVQALGELEVVSSDDWADTSARMDLAYYGHLGAPEPGDRGGATYTFRGTGGKVCVLADPEAVFWNQSVAATSPNANYSWPDNYMDDGDLDMSVGLSANYSGSPGLEIGDFRGRYTDSLGNTVQIEYDLCETFGYYGQSPAHPGRAMPEYCTIDTDGREGVEYTVLLKTWSLPLDDSVLSFGTVVYEGSCRSITECTIMGETHDIVEDGGGPAQAIRNDEYLGLEAAFCDNDLAEFCPENPHLCGDPE